MNFKHIQNMGHCPHCNEKLMTRVLIKPNRYGYEAEHIKFCEEHGTIKSAHERVG